MKIIASFSLLLLSFFLMLTRKVKKHFCPLSNFLEFIIRYERKINDLIFLVFQELRYKLQSFHLVSDNTNFYHCFHAYFCNFKEYRPPRLFAKFHSFQIRQWPTAKSFSWFLTVEPWPMKIGALSACNSMESLRILRTLLSRCWWRECCRETRYQLWLRREKSATDLSRMEEDHSSFRKFCKKGSSKSIQ